jgi:FkbM family methyltransferase
MLSVINAIKRKYATVTAWRPFLATNADWLRACFLHVCGRKRRFWGSLRIPLRPKNETRPVYCRSGTSDFVTFQEIFLNEEYRLAREIPVADVRGILDLGANVGLAARWFLLRFPDAQIVGVEPDAANAASARRNLMATKADSRHRIIHAFAGGASRNAFLSASGECDANEGMLQDTPVTGRTAVPVLTGAELCDLAGCALDIAKIDIEGSEKELLEADVGWLRAFTWIFIEVHDPLDESWLASIVSRRLPTWEVTRTERRHGGAFLAFLRNRHAVSEKSCG